MDPALYAEGISEFGDPSLDLPLTNALIYVEAGYTFLDFLDISLA